MYRYGKLNWIVIAALLAVIVVLLVLLIGNLEKPQPPVDQDKNPSTEVTQPSEPQEIHLEIEKVEEQADVVVVTTNYCEIKYPYAFSDLVKVEAVNDDGIMSLLFVAQIEESKIKLYELFLGGEKGMHIGSLTLSQGQGPVDVYAVIYEADANVNADNRITFIAAQETFNDVMVSLMENENFVPAT